MIKPRRTRSAVLLALASAALLSGCYYDPYGYYYPWGYPNPYPYPGGYYPYYGGNAYPSPPPNPAYPSGEMSQPPNAPVQSSPLPPPAP